MGDFPACFCEHTARERLEAAVDTEFTETWWSVPCRLGKDPPPGPRDISRRCCLRLEAETRLTESRSSAGMLCDFFELAGLGPG